MHVEEQIIIGTPGKMLDWVLKLKIIDAAKIICLVFDEADVMISQQGYQDQSLRLHKFVLIFLLAKIFEIVFWNFANLCVTVFFFVCFFSVL